jgi:hypothetical protein
MKGLLMPDKRSSGWRPPFQRSLQLVTKAERHMFYIGAASKLYKSLCADVVDI